MKVTRVVSTSISLVSLVSMASAAAAQEATEYVDEYVDEGVEAPADGGVTDEELLTPGATPGFNGSTGLFRLLTADGLPQNHFALSLQGEFFSGSDVIVVGDSDRRFGGRLALGWGITDHVELSVGLGAHSNFNDAAEPPAPELIQSVGNVAFALRGYGEVTPGLSLGAQFGGELPAAASDVGLDLGASIIEIQGLATADFRAWSPAPLRAHLNIGYSIDGEEDLFSGKLTRIERFGHDVRGYDSVRLGLGVDAPLKYISPSIEWNLDVPVGAPCEVAPGLPACVADLGFSSFPSTLVIGAKGRPLAGVTLSAGVELGVTTKESQGTPAIPAWNMLFGASYELDPRPRVVERVVEVEVPAEESAAQQAATSYVVGIIVDGATQQPVAGARVKYPSSEYSDQVTGPDGRFRSYDMAPGTVVNIEISHPDYQTRAQRMTVAADVRTGNVALQQAISGTRIVGRVRSATDPNLAATLTLQGPETRTIEVDPAAGSFEVDVKPGEYRVTVSAPGHVSTTDTVVLNSGRQELNYNLVALPTGTRVRIAGTAILIDDANAQVTFEGERLTQDSRETLNQVAELLAADGSLKLTIRSHTDARENPAEATRITQRRARAVLDYLTSRGIDADRLQAAGAGDGEPIYPNISDRNRRRNNRVEFQLDRR